VRLVHAVADREQMVLDHPGLNPRLLAMLLALSLLASSPWRSGVSGSGCGS